MIRLRSPSRSPPDVSNDAFSSSLTTTVVNQRSMRWLETSLRRAVPKGQTFIFHAAPHQEPDLHRLLLAFRTHKITSVRVDVVDREVVHAGLVGMTVPNSA